MAQLRSHRDPGSPVLSLNSLPETSLEFLRRYREVEINNLLIEYVIPLYEQAKIEEKKDYPVLQVIDFAKPPAKKSYPPRTLFAFVGALSVTLLVYVLLRVRHAMINITDPRYLSLIEEARRWHWRTLDKK
jgi:uncharacterized protein involved in exopolysaccharide biosynthesis